MSAVRTPAAISHTRASLCVVRGQPVIHVRGRLPVAEERFLIADIEMQADFPAERRFWFAPKFHSGESALMHRQADNVWRIDFQLGWNADPEAEKDSTRVQQRGKGVRGDARGADGAVLVGDVVRLDEDARPLPAGVRDAAVDVGDFQRDVVDAVTVPAVVVEQWTGRVDAAGEHESDGAAA